MNKESPNKPHHREFQIRKSGEVTKKQPLTSRNSIHIDRNIMNIINNDGYSVEEKETSINIKDRKTTHNTPIHRTEGKAQSLKLPPLHNNRNVRGEIKALTTKSVQSTFIDNAHRMNEGPLTPRSKITIGNSNKLKSHGNVKSTFNSTRNLFKYAMLII